MRKADSLILIGFLLIIIGSIFIALFGVGEGSTFFVIFPFVVFGDLSADFTIVAVAMMAIVTIMFLLSFRQFFHISHYDDEWTICNHCGKATISSARFCSSCGLELPKVYDESNR